MTTKCYQFKIVDQSMNVHNGPRCATIEELREAMVRTLGKGPLNVREWYISNENGNCIIPQNGVSVKMLIPDVD